jgi:hypothetical protein
LRRLSALRGGGLPRASAVRPAHRPELVRETLARCWGMLLVMPDKDETQPGDAPREASAPLFSQDEALERVRAVLTGKNADFCRALFTMLCNETPRERDDARSVALLELIAVDLTSPAAPTDVPAAAMPGATFAQRPPTFR